MRGTVPNGLYPHNISQTVPGSGHPGPATPLRPLNVPWMFEGGGR